MDHIRSFPLTSGKWAYKFRRTSPDSAEVPTPRVPAYAAAWYCGPRESARGKPNELTNIGVSIKHRQGDDDA